MSTSIDRESSLHGDTWNSAHGGYFSNPDIAAPLLTTIRERIKPGDTVVDLGGGTGTLLSLLKQSPLPPDTSLVNMDGSDAQLASARKRGLTCVKQSVDSFTRNAVTSGPAVFIMRSVLHYFGKDGLVPVLKHIREQVESGEFFIHQTASFERQQDADCLNDLYDMMGTGKWYPTVDYLNTCLKQAGWQILDVSPAPPLPLTADELTTRYSIGKDRMTQIAAKLSKHDVPSTVFAASPPLSRRSNGQTGAEPDQPFTAYLHYHTWMVY